jgi:hypothetical protein
MFGTKIDRFTTQDGALDLQLISAIITLMFSFFADFFFLQSETCLRVNDVRHSTVT